VGGGPGEPLRPLYRIYNSSTFDRRKFLNPNYLDLMLYGITGTELPHDRKYREQFRLPDLLASGTWKVVSQREVVDGAECLVIESSETDKLWLDSKAGFGSPPLERNVLANGKSTTMIFISVGRLLGSLSHCRNRLSRCRISRSVKPETKYPPSIGGSPRYEFHHELSVFELNQPVGQEYFQLVPPPGARVFDSTAQPLDPSGKPAAPWPVPYIQPDDPADVPQAIKEAQLKLGNSNQRGATQAGSSIRGIPPPGPERHNSLDRDL